MYKVLLFLLIFRTGISLCFGQDICVLDSNTKQPIPYVTVKFGNNKGLYANEKGLFVIKPDEYSFLELNHIAYNTLKIEKEKVNDTLYMSPKINTLDEVLIQKNNRPELVLKPEKKAHNYGSFALFPQTELVTVIHPVTKIVNASVKNVSFFFSNNVEKMDEADVFKTMDALVRINIYEVVNAIQEKKLYTSEPLKISSYIKDGLVLDLSGKEVRWSEKGLCFGLELIGYTHGTQIVYDQQAFVRPSLTERQNKMFTSKSYLKYVFDDITNHIPINEILKRGMPDGKEIDRNLIIGLTVIPE